MASLRSIDNSPALVGLSPLSGLIIDVYLKGNGDPVDPYAGHAMLLVGYNRLKGYFEFKNSWGAGSGHSGYVRLSYEYVQAYGKYGYYITGATNP